MKLFSGSFWRPDRSPESGTPLTSRSIAKLMMAIGVVCVVAGGLISAALAHRPEQTAMWLVAYLVLVGGVAQIALGWLAYNFTVAARNAWTVVVFAAYTIGNGLVVWGRLLKDVDGQLSQLIVMIGTSIFMLSMLLALVTIRPNGRWSQLAFYSIVIVLLLSAPIGIVLTLRSSPDAAAFLAIAG